MNILISGYGKMGHEIEKLALQNGDTICGIFDTPGDWLLKAALLNDCDVVIDFSMPGMAIHNITACLDAGKPIVCGTTGWHDQLDTVKDLCEQKSGAIFYSPNFSLGVNIFLKINALLGRLMNQYPAYNVQIEEIHHTQKLDAPSGTAILIANNLLGEYHLKQGWKKAEQAGPEDIPVHSVRTGTVPGTHSVIYKSDCDQIVLQHEAFNRQGFVIGALAAARWLIGRKGFYSMKDLLAD